MRKRNIEKLYAPPGYHWVGDGFRVHNFIPSQEGLKMERMTPFVLLDYASKFDFPPSLEPRGVGVHPHRGFETVTIAYKGKVQHHDSSGGGGIIGEGDVQWMTAASGVLHKEYHETEWSKQGGPFQMVQLWVNLPAKEKMGPPKYQAIINDMMGKVLLPDGMGVVEVIAGEYLGTKGVATTFSPIHLMNARVKDGANLSFSFPDSYNTALVVLEGEIVVNGNERAPLDYLVLFRNDGEEFSITAKKDSVVLVMSGELIKEPISAHGPFVMNTRPEIIQAFDDFNNGKFGHLE